MKLNASKKRYVWLCALERKYYMNTTKHAVKCFLIQLPFQDAELEILFYPTIYITMRVPILIPLIVSHLQPWTQSPLRSTVLRCRCRQHVNEFVSAMRVGSSISSQCKRLLTGMGSIHPPANRIQMLQLFADVITHRNTTWIRNKALRKINWLPDT